MQLLVVFAFLSINTLAEQVGTPCYNHFEKRVKEANTIALNHLGTNSFDLCQFWLFNQISIADSLLEECFKWYHDKNATEKLQAIDTIELIKWDTIHITKELENKLVVDVDLIRNVELSLISARHITLGMYDLEKIRLATKKYNNSCDVPLIDAASIHGGKEYIAVMCEYEQTYKKLIDTYPGYQNFKKEQINSIRKRIEESHFPSIRYETLDLIKARIHH